MNAEELIDTARTLVAGGKGLLAMAESNSTCSKRFAKPGIAFLSGGQRGELASARLNAMNVRFRSRLPWALTSSSDRAIQQPALAIWSGRDVNIKVVQQALLDRAGGNLAARRGEYNAAMERT